ncbi:hypothetical protein KFE25_009156 [Diacronema lutheri]|uniref:RWD domain-containing protein 3 n=1 Tax=Diacronema lutheri TaxID=2081491 RepID=A0A8J6CHX5_DIALT|nr:hypothetical protein KFE25_009156 [Diacronema lutheri]
MGSGRTAIDGEDEVLAHADADHERQLLLATFVEDGELELDTTVWRVRPSSGRGLVTLVAQLSGPQPYPSSPALITLEAPSVGATAHRRLIAALEREIIAGNVFDASMRLASLLDGEVDLAAERVARSPAVVPADASPAFVETVLVRIDHMNNLKGYLHALDRLVAGACACARVFWRQPDSGRHAAVDVLVALRAPAESQRGSSALDAALTRLRSEHVDVDSRGFKCKERQSSILRRQVEPATDAPCFAPEERFGAERYADHGELLSRLRSLGGAVCLAGVQPAEMRRCPSGMAGTN